jgi:hypothetical protein
MLVSRMHWSVECRSDTLLVGVNYLSKIVLVPVSVALLGTV